MKQEVNYKTWIRSKRIIIISIAEIISILLVISLQGHLGLQLIFALLSIGLGYTVLIIGYSAYKFSNKGGDYQRIIHAKLASLVDEANGDNILDIGAGSGSLIIMLAKRFKHAKLVGIDFWGENWQYSKSLCEANAKSEGVLNQITFQKETASCLPFSDNTFSIAVSCLTFHEVQDQADKYQVLAEGLRVVKPGGQFVFLDLFFDQRIYGSKAKLNAKLEQFNLSSFEIIPLSEEIELNWILNHKNVLKNAVIIKGIK